MTEHDPVDLMVLMQAILRSAISDYVNYQPVEKRSTAEAKRTFETAVDMLFDKDYEAMKLYNPEGTTMNLRDIVDFAQPYNHIRLEEFRERVIEEAQEASKNIETPLYVASHVVLYGTTYSIVPGDESKVDFENRLIYITKNKVNTKLEYLSCLLQIAAYHSEARISLNELNTLSEALYEMIRLNNGFIKLK